MDVAERTSKLSYAIRLQVGAVIVKDNRILSYGYNGMPSGWDNVCENKEYLNAAKAGFMPESDILEKFPHEEYVEEYQAQRKFRLVTKDEVLHAESNAIAKVSGSTESSDGATIFCTHAPCIHCAKMIWQSGIKHIYYRDTYRDSKGLEFLEKSGVNVVKYVPQS